MGLFGGEDALRTSGCRRSCGASLGGIGWGLSNSGWRGVASDSLLLRLLSKAFSDSSVRCLCCRLTLQKLLNRPTNTPFPGPSQVTTEILFPGSAWLGPVGSEAAGGGRRQQLFCYRMGVVLDGPSLIAISQECGVVVKRCCASAAVQVSNGCHEPKEDAIEVGTDSSKCVFGGWSLKT